jgi:uncharacterized protein DUF1707
MTRRAMMRASDSDREHVAERLRDAAAEGRLLADELEERLGAALKARTYGDLDRLVVDLPSTYVGPSRSRALTRRPATLVATTIALGLLLLAVLAAALGGHGHPDHHWGGDGAWVIWLVWLAVGWRLLTRRRRSR